MPQLLHLPRFVPTLLAILFQPLTFFRAYHHLVTTREMSFWDVNAERAGDHYLGPVKFAALAMAISNLLFPLVLSRGVQVGAVSPDYAAFPEWAEAQGYLDPLSLTGIGIIDDFVRDLLGLLVFYGLGHLMALFSAGKISARFAAGYFFYWNAWSLAGTLTGFGLILISRLVPFSDTTARPDECAPLSRRLVHVLGLSHLVLASDPGDFLAAGRRGAVWGTGDLDCGHFPCWLPGRGCARISLNRALVGPSSSPQRYCPG